MSDDLVKSLRDRAISAREEGTMTAKVDAIHFEKSADRIEELEAKLAKVVAIAEDAIETMESGPFFPE